MDRAWIAASAAGSLRLEGLEVTGPVRALADLWVRGTASDADLREGERRLLAGESLEDLLASLAARGRASRQA
jgi:Antitoxin VbhA